MPVMKWLRKLTSQARQPASHRRFRLRLEALEDRCVPADHVAFLQAPSRVAAGKLISPAVTVAIEDADTIYVATAGGGVWKTADGGTTWNALTDNLSGAFHKPVPRYTGSIALAPSNPQIVYAGGGYGGVPLSGGGGVLKSTDGGTSW